MNNTMEIVLAGISEPNVHWTKYPAQTCFECRVGLLLENDGTFSVYAINLPGVSSQGESEQEAITNISDALVGVLSEYIAAGEIPWTDEFLEENVIEKRVLINLSNTPMAV